MQWNRRMLLPRTETWLRITALPLTCTGHWAKQGTHLGCFSPPGLQEPEQRFSSLRKHLWWFIHKQISDTCSLIHVSLETCFLNNSPAWLTEKPDVKTIRLEEFSKFYFPKKKNLWSIFKILTFWKRKGVNKESFSNLDIWFFLQSELDLH